MKTAAIVVVGNEILSGKVADENATYLLKALRDLGVTLRRITVIPDEVDIIAQTVRDLHTQVDFLFTSGGVGPTHDDLTVRGIAKGLGRGVTRAAVLEERMREHYGDELPEAALRMAEVPEGAEMVASDKLRWPVCVVENVYVFPGVPEIFRNKFDAIRERFREAPFVLRSVYLRADESRIADALADIVAEFPTVDVGSYPRRDAGGPVVRVTLESKDECAVTNAVTRLLERAPTGSVDRTE